MHHIFFIHSSVEGHLVCFQVLAVTKKNAAMYTVEQVSCGMNKHPLSICPRVVLLGLEVD